MRQVDLDRRPVLETEGATTGRGSDLEQRLGRKDASAAALAACDPLELAELFEGVDSHVRVGADAEADAAMAEPDGGNEPVAEIGLGRRAGADGGAVGGEQVELASVGVRRVDDGRPLRQAAAVCEQLDRAAAVLGEALLDLSRLLAGVNMERQRLVLPVASDLLEPVARTRAHGVGSEADRDSFAA